MSETTQLNTMAQTVNGINTRGGGSGYDTLTVNKMDIVAYESQQTIPPPNGGGGVTAGGSTTHSGMEFRGTNQKSVKIYPSDMPIQTSSPDLSPTSSRKNSEIQKSRQKASAPEVRFDIKAISTSHSGGPSQKASKQDKDGALNIETQKRINNLSGIRVARTSDTERQHILDLTPPQARGGKSVTFKPRGSSSPRNTNLPGLQGGGGTYNFNPPILTTLKPKLVRVTKNFSLITHDELTASYGLKGYRLKLALFLRSRMFDVLSLFVTSLYSLLIFLYLAFEDYLFPQEHLNTFYTIELAILGLFLIDIGLHLISFRCLYLQDSWNLVDMIIIFLCLAFVLLDMFADNQFLKNALKVRIIFRLLRIFLLIRKINALREIKEMEMRRGQLSTMATTNGYDMRSPLEQVIEIITRIKDLLDQHEKPLIQDLNYCLKVISSNQLYEAEIFVTNDPRNSGGGSGSVQGEKSNDRFGNKNDVSDRGINEYNRRASASGANDPEGSRHIEIVNLIQTYSKGPVEVIDVDQGRMRQSTLEIPIKKQESVNFKKKSLFNRRTGTGQTLPYGKETLATDEQKFVHLGSGIQQSPEDWIPDITEREVDESYILDFFKVSQRAREEFAKIKYIHFNIFSLHQEHERHYFVPVIAMILSQEQVFQNLNVSFETFLHFIHKIKAGYNNVPYHNKTHGADVSQTFYYFGNDSQGGMFERLGMSTLEIFATIIGGACHDFAHPGFSNQYLIEIKDPIAIKYNDNSVLESFHIASTFEVMNQGKTQPTQINMQNPLNGKESQIASNILIDQLTDMQEALENDLQNAKLRVSGGQTGGSTGGPVRTSGNSNGQVVVKKGSVSYDILENLSREDYKRVRKLMISCILGTDMSQHFSELAKFKARLSSPDFNPKVQDKDMIMMMMFHLADISNSTKPWEVCRQWTELLFVEFFAQGDLERQKGMPISYLMDRSMVNIAKSQIGFLDVIILPAFTAASQIVNLNHNLDNIDKNKQKWQNLFEEYETRMQAEAKKVQEISFNLA